LARADGPSRSSQRLVGVERTEQKMPALKACRSQRRTGSSPGPANPTEGERNPLSAPIWAKTQISQRPHNLAHWHAGHTATARHATGYPSGPSARRAGFRPLRPSGSGAWRTRGVRLVADDLDWTVGTGPEVHDSGEALLMATVTRRAALDDLTGPVKAHWLCISKGCRRLLLRR
jgi:hypothetical protein